MPTRITEIEPRNSNSDRAAGSLDAQSTNSAETAGTWGDQPTLFKVEGTLYVKDAELLEKICRDVSRKSGRPVVVELSDLCFLDSESAAILCRMKREQGVSLEGLNLFIKKVVELADEAEKARRYLPNR
jgi:anti-anti-sigma regulatory factor